MNRSTQRLERLYSAALDAYMREGTEPALARAYELVRMLAAKGVGVLDLAHIFQKVLGTVLAVPGIKQDQLRIFQRAEAFFMESLSPFDLTHRGFLAAIQKLNQTVADLKQRHRELAEMNRELKSEIIHRKRTEKSLRESQRQLRALFEEARQMEDNLRRLSSRVLNAQEEERRRISQELHDEVGQALTAISVSLAVVKSGGYRYARSMSDSIGGVQHVLEQTMETVHRFARELRPAMLDELGLLPTLRSNLKGFAERTGLRVRLRANPVVERLDPEQKTVIFRVAQESLTNVAKHARATQVKVLLQKVRDCVRLEIADNGQAIKGGIRNLAKGKARLGLVGMQERVRLVNGQFMVKSVPGRGTTVRVVLPFNRASGPLHAPKACGETKPRGPGRRQSASPQGRNET